MLEAIAEHQFVLVLVNAKSNELIPEAEPDHRCQLFAKRLRKVVERKLLAKVKVLAIDSVAFVEREEKFEAELSHFGQTDFQLFSKPRDCPMIGREIRLWSEMGIST